MLDIADYTQIGVESNPSNATILTLHTPYKAQKLEIALANGLDSLIESRDRQRQARESQKSQQDKGHNTDITSHHIESKQKDSQHNTKQIIDSKPTSSVRESRESKPIDSDSVCARSGGNGGLAPIDDTNLPQANCNEIIDSLLTLKIINGGYKDKLWSYGEENTQANLLHTNTETKDSKTTQENKEKQILEIYFSYGNGTTRLQGDSRHTQDVNLHIITQGYNNGEEIHITLEIQGKKLSVSGIIQDNQAIIMNVLSSKGK